MVLTLHNRTLFSIGTIGSDTYACVTDVFFFKGVANIYEGDRVYVKV